MPLWMSRADGLRRGWERTRVTVHLWERESLSWLVKGKLVP